MNNKTRFQEWCVFAALIVWAMCLIVTCAGLWNAATQVKVGGFVIATSIITVLINLAVIFYIGKKTWDKFGQMSIEESNTKKNEEK